MLMNAEVINLDRDRHGDIITCEFVQKHSLILRLIQGFILPGRLKCRDGVCRSPFNAEHEYKLVSLVEVPIHATLDNSTTVTRTLATFDCNTIRDRIQFSGMLTIIALLVLFFIFKLRLHLLVARALGFGDTANRQKQN